MPEDSTLEPGAPSGAPTQAKVAELIGKIRAQQSLPLGIVGGTLGAGLGAAAWAAITGISNYQIGYVAVGIGFIVGYGVRTLGRGIDRAFGVAGAVLALLGCVAGSIGADAILAAKEMSVSPIVLLGRLTPALAVELFRTGFGVLDLLFYAIALYFGYRYSFYRPSAAELAALDR